MQVKRPNLIPSMNTFKWKNRDVHCLDNAYLAQSVLKEACQKEDWERLMSITRPTGVGSSPYLLAYPFHFLEHAWLINTVLREMGTFGYSWLICRGQNNYKLTIGCI